MSTAKRQSRMARITTKTAKLSRIIYTKDGVNDSTNRNPNVKAENPSGFPCTEDEE